jgi:hypothetical protein
MSKTPFSKQCEILGSLWLLQKSEGEKQENWQKYFDYFDVALPLAYVVWNDIAPEETISESGIGFVDEAFDTLCELIAVDKETEYLDIEHMFSLSPYNYLAS